jgi:hypothetical protein
MLKRIGYFPLDPNLFMYREIPTATTRALPNQKETQKEMVNQLITPEQPKLALLPGTVQSDGDYLSPLPVGSEFIARKEPSMLGYDVQHWIIKRKTRFARLLTLGEQQDIWVTPREFCNKNKLVEIIYGTGNRTDRPANMEPATPDQHKLDVDA